MDVDSPEQRGSKRPAEETDASEPPKPKRIKVGERRLIKLPSPHEIIVELTVL